MGSSIDTFERRSARFIQCGSGSGCARIVAYGPVDAVRDAIHPICMGLDSFARGYVQLLLGSYGTYRFVGFSLRSDFCQALALLSCDGGAPLRGELISPIP